MVSDDVRKIGPGFILPSAALVLKRSQVRFFRSVEKRPEIGDVAYGTICLMGQHSSLENASGRIHMIQDGTKAVFVYGCRYAPDYFEGTVPERVESTIDLLARSGIIGVVRTKNSRVKDPTRVRLSGYVCNSAGEVLNTRSFPALVPKSREKRTPRARMILVCGTSMNAGKSLAAAACCWALSNRGYRVRASKVTGTASLKDILLMNDAGAERYADFSYMGYPSTYLLPEEDLFGIFDRLDLKFANNPRNFWVVELADGINQRETAMLLNAPRLRERIHRLVFCASDAFGAIGGIRMLHERFNLEPDAISGVCSGSPLHIQELSEFTSVPVFDSARPSLRHLSEILLPRRRDQHARTGDLATV